MRFLGIGDWNELGPIYLHLLAEGHQVRVHIAEPSAHEVLGGMVDRCEDWRAELGWVRAAGADGVILCETAAFGDTQDALRRDGYQVIGGSAMGDRLERDRRHGQEMLRRSGIPTIPSWSFLDAASTAAYIRDHPGRYVLKYDGDAGPGCQTYPGRAADGADLRALLEARADACGPRHQLMAHVDGVEVGVGAYFNGQRFLDPPCMDWEHKHFFAGGIGELTGEMGTVVTYAAPARLFDRTLGRLAEPLRRGGYRGYINLNLIVDERGIWPLEFTSRFGYPGSAILGVLQSDGWGALFRTLLDPSSRRHRAEPGFAVGVVLSVPPFPYHEGYERLSKGTAIAFAGLDEDDRRHLHLGEVAIHDGKLRCAGNIGALMTVTGTGADAAAARDAAYARVQKVVVPNLRWREDIGRTLIQRDLERLRGWGWL